MKDIDKLQSGIKESEFVAQCKQWLELRGCVIMQTHSGYRKPVECGIPDLIGSTPEGRCIVVECKKEGGRLLQVQEWTLEKFRTAGAIVIIPHSLDGLMREYEKPSGWDMK